MIAFSMVQMLAMGLGVTIGGAHVSLGDARWGSVLIGFRLGFVCMGAITLASALIFRRIETEQRVSVVPSALEH